MKKCALINDLSGFGKCSLGVGIPIISVLGIEAHPMPTAVLSAQTGYSSYKKVDLTEYMPLFFNEWNKLGFEFDGILTGYFSAEEQVEAAADFAGNSNALLLVDPVMGDDGQRYDGFTDSLCEKIKALAFSADIITPNVTELYLLTGESDIQKGAEILLSAGVKSVVVTGIKKGNKIGNAVFEKDRRKEFYSDYSEGISYSGTGDMLASIVMGKVLSGNDVFTAVKTATEFISLVIKNSDVKNRNDGVDFEKYLYRLGCDNNEKK
ncbi:MAG: bifunctional hydroxymethylpyrimidine kinase/phosphomethylpyrimidine kinase [Eubacterium sp.]|nr:bifunctional hydroxymethylpyrimidine kinase/phosphomethylpyrimidine kinase [Eubacterium sp.]